MFNIGILKEDKFVNVVSGLIFRISIQTSSCIIKGFLKILITLEGMVWNVDIFGSHQLWGTIKNTLALISLIHKQILFPHHGVPLTPLHRLPIKAPLLVSDWIPNICLSVPPTTPPFLPGPAASFAVYKPHIRGGSQLLLLSPVSVEFFVFCFFESPVSYTFQVATRVSFSWLYCTGATLWLAEPW